MKKYYALIFVIIVVVAIFSSALGTKLESLHSTMQAFAMLAFVIPTCLLLYAIGKDEKIRKGIRLIAKIGIAFLIFCYIGGLLAEFV